MPYDPELAHRIRAHLHDVPGLTERKMFGGIGWMIHGNMAAGASSKGGLIIRCSREDFPGLIALPGAEPMKRGDTPMTGWIHVEPASVAGDDALSSWLARGQAYASGLPAK